ncbi:MAG TPA: zinc-binding dehydrogenase [Tepidisphaeraceae bacterium]|nr:zinc-binding dehydrogenase [Tepidisphaeraceae bacterium]
MPQPSRAGRLLPGRRGGRVHRGQRRGAPTQAAEPRPRQRRRHDALRPDGVAGAVRLRTAGARATGADSRRGRRRRQLRGAARPLARRARDRHRLRARYRLRARARRAHEAIDYAAAPFETGVRGVDVVLDSVGGAVTERSWSALRPGGLLVTIVRPPSPQSRDGRAASGLFFIVEPSRAQLNALSRLIEDGTVRPIVEAVLPLERAREAYDRGIRGHPRGKLVLGVTDPPAQ